MRVVVLAIVLLAARLASAGPEEETAAQVHLDRGIAAFENGSFAVAHEEFVQSNKLAPTMPNPYRWLALTEVQLGDCASARTNIEAFLERVAADDARRAEMLRLRELCTRTGTLAIRTTPESAELRIDGAHVGKAPYRSGSFAIGNHSVVAESPGYEPLTRGLAVTAGGSLDVHLELERASSPITKRWWFIPAIAGAVAVVGGGIYLATRDGGESTSSLPGVICDAKGCRPGGP
jgi:PEGA domain